MLGYSGYGYKYKGVEKLIMDWLLGNTITEKKSSKEIAGFSRSYYHLTYKRGFTGALRILADSPNSTTICFINNRSHYRGCSYPKSYSTKTSFVSNYICENSKKLQIKVYEVPFYAFNEAGLNLHECEVLDYNKKNHNILLSTKVDNLYITYKKIPAHKGDVEWKFVNKEIQSLHQLVNK